MSQLSLLNKIEKLKYGVLFYLDANGKTFQLNSKAFKEMKSLLHRVEVLLNDTNALYSENHNWDLILEERYENIFEDFNNLLKMTYNIFC